MAPDDVERRLAAILSADAVGYSRLMAEDEAATIQTLRSYRAVIQTLVEEHRGRVVDAPGDNLLAEFPTALDSVAAAAEIQRVLAARNLSLPEPRRMLFRIGIHMGDVAVEGGRVYGDGVNVAARLEGLAEPGGICVSATVHEQVRRKLELTFADLGTQRIKNIPDAVRVYQVRLDEAQGADAHRGVGTHWIGATAIGIVLVLAIGGGWWLATRSPAPEPVAETGAETEESHTVPGFGGLPAIAVLPFDNLSGDPDQAYFADGIAEDLLTRLSSWRTFPVIARNSSFVYKGRAVDVKQVSRELGARYVVEGSVRREGERIRITAQLIDGSTGHHVWAERYDRDYVNVFALQDEITESIVAAMNPALLHSERKRALTKDPADLDAWELVLRAQSAMLEVTHEGNVTARMLAERALELAPGMPEPYVQLGLSHLFDVWLQWSDDPERSLAEALRAGQRAVALAETNPYAHLALGLAQGVAGRGEDEIRALDRAIELDPSSAIALSAWGSAVSQRGRGEEGVAAVERAIRLSPKDPRMWMHSDAMAYAAFGTADYERVIEASQHVLRARPGYAWGHVMLAASEAQLGRDAEARVTARRALELQPDLTLEFVRAIFASTDADYRTRLVDGLRQAGVPEG